MTARPEDVARIREIAAELETTARTDSRLSPPTLYHLASELRSAASRLEGEGRDGARVIVRTERIGAICYHCEKRVPRVVEGPSVMHIFPQGYRVSCPDFRVIQSPAPASSPQPTTTTEEHENE